MSGKLRIGKQKEVALKEQELEAKIKTFDFDKLKEFVSSIPDGDLELIDGIKLLCPSHSGMLWDESLKNDFYEEFSNYIEDYLTVLFEQIDNN